MPYELRARNGGNLVLIRHSGHVNSTEITDAIAELDRARDPDHFPRLLVDVRAAASLPMKEELLNWQWQNVRTAPRVKRFALVTSDLHRETMEAIASVQESLGTPARVFADELEALTWVMRSRQSAPGHAHSSAFQELSSVRVFVSDIDRARQFYSDILGLGPYEFVTRDNESLFRLTNASFLLEVVAQEDDRFDRLVGRETGIYFRVRDLDGTYIRLASQGVQFRCEPERRETGERVLCFQDPDNNVLTLIS